jgi:hypothetical protein
MNVLASSLGRLLISMVLLAVLFPIVIRFFRGTWKQLDEAAAAERAAALPGDRSGLRAPLTFVLAALSLLFINYYGSREFFLESIFPWLGRFADAHPGLLHLDYFDDLYWRVYWGLSRYAAYLFPLLVWPFIFRQERRWDLGLRFRGFREHAWIYVLCLVVIIPTLYLVSFLPDFHTYYPMYPSAGRSWVDFLAWEALYLGQFLTLEIFFRGFFLRGARALGASAIFAMVVPYVMIHFPKPYLEACGAIVAGIVLGSLSMQTGSIWAGFLVHATVAVLMDVLALERGAGMPRRLTPTSQPGYAFTHGTAVLWSLWGLAVVALVILLRRRRRLATKAPRRPRKPRRRR